MRGKKGLLLVVVLVTLTVVVVNCGGGGSSSSSATNNANTTTYNIAGIVTLSGAGLQGVTMTFNSFATATTDASGSFSVTGLVNGSYTVTPSKTGFVFTPVNSVQNVNSANVSSVNFTATSVPIEWSAIGGWGVVVDSAGDVYVAEMIDQIEKFTSTGTLITQWGSSGNGNSQFSTPKDISLDSSNNLYVADCTNHRIQKFSSSGSYITQWGSYGSGNGQFNGPTGIAVDITNSWVYVVDSNNSRIQKFDLSGNYITQWGSNGTGNSQFRFDDFAGGQQGPEGHIAVDSTGAVYVVDNWNHRIQKFTSTGTYITQWGSTGSGNGQFLYPVGIAIDGTGAVYVVDNSTSGNGVGNVGRIEKFDSSGNFISQFVLLDSSGLPAYGIGVASDSLGVLYVTQGNSIAKYTP